MSSCHQILRSVTLNYTSRNVVAYTLNYSTYAVQQVNQSVALVWDGSRLGVELRRSGSVDEETISPSSDGNALAFQSSNVQIEQITY